MRQQVLEAHDVFALDEGERGESNMRLRQGIVHLLGSL